MGTLKPVGRNGNQVGELGHYQTLKSSYVLNG